MVKLSDLQMGNECPKCGEVIYTSWTDKLHDPEDSIDSTFCWIKAEGVEPDISGQEIAGNVIIIDHDGPSI